MNGGQLPTNQLHDIINEHCFATQLQLFEKHPHACIIGSVLCFCKRYINVIICTHECEINLHMSEMNNACPDPE